MNEQRPNNGWSRAEMYVINKLDELEREVRETKKLAHCIDKKLVALNVKSGVWGLLGGLLPVVGAVLLYVLKS